MNILIIGGRGFLGLQLKADIENTLSFAKVYISSERKQLAGTDTIYVNYECLSSVGELINLIKPQYILHLASYCLRDSSDYALAKGQLRDDNILNALSSSEFNSKFIFVSSMAVFSMSDKEIAPSGHKPHSNYGLEKLYMIKKLSNFNATRGTFSYKIVYPSSIYGKGQRGKMFLPRLFEHIQKGVLMSAYGGNKKRDFIHVKDVSRVLVKLISGYEKYPEKHIFLHSFILHKISEIANIVCEIVKFDPKEIIVFHDTKDDLIRDAEEFQVVAGNYSLRPEFTTTVPIFDGLKEMFGKS
jgi:nucleoside-diphosphate-sugar epimerase